MEYNRLERFELWLGRNWPRSVLLLVVLCVAFIPAKPVYGYELTDNRTATTKTYYLGNNQYHLESYIYPIHYNDGGDWYDIDSDYSVADTGAYTAMFTKLPYVVRMGDDSGRRIYPDRDDLSYWIEFYKPFPNMGTPEKAGGYWYWNFTNSIIAVKVANNAVKFAFRLKNSDSPSSITIPFSTQGISRIGNLLYHDYEVIAVLQKPYAIDANGVYRDCSVQFGTGEITVSLDTTGLAYPIDIDPSVNVQVGASDDDADEYGDGTFDTTGTVLETRARSSPAGSSYYKCAGARFEVTGIASGDTVDSATIDVYCGGSNNRSYNDIYFNDVDDANDFSTEADIIDTRVKTTAYVNWEDGTLATNDWNTSPELKTVVQEVVDRGGWSAGNHMVAMFIAVTDANHDPGDYYSYDNGAHANGPKLDITYTAGGGIVPPTVTTNTPNAVCETSANVSGNITATGGENPYWAGFYFDDDGTPYSDEQGSSGTFGVGEFTENITGLSPGTKYHYIASANNTGGQGSGSEITFITLPTGPTDISSPETGNSTANLTWSAVAGGGVDRYEIRRAAGAAPPGDNTSGDLVYNSNGTSTQDSGLTPGTQYTYSLFTIAEDDGLESCSANYTFITIWTHPGDVYGISTSNVQQTQFQVDWTQGQNSENTTITWRDDASYPADPTDGTEAYNGVGTSTNVTGLAAGTDYYVGMWGYDTDSGLWSINGYFFIQATAAGLTAPTVTTSDATGVEETVATVGGEITNAGGENCTRLVYYDTDLVAPYSANWTDAGTWAEGVFSHELTGLTKGDKYAFMASANNTAGSGNGTVKYFMTKPDEPTSGNATGGTGNITLAWTNGEGNDSNLVYGKQGAYPSAIGDGTLVYSGSDNTTVHSGLGNNETWYYRVWSSSTEDGTTTYSDTYTEMTGITDTLVPSMQTDAATSVYYNSATLNGQVLDTGGENPDVYFFWGTTDGGTNPGNWSDNYSMGSQSGAFSHGITGLDPDTMYFFTVRGINGAGTDWGSTVNFTTLSAPATTPGGGRPAPATTTTTTGSIELPQLMLMLPLAACSIFAFWKENVILFYIAFGLSMITGLYGPDIAEGNTSTMGLMVGISFIAYAFVCFAFGMRLTFWRGE